MTRLCNVKSISLTVFCIIITIISNVVALSNLRKALCENNGTVILKAAQTVFEKKNVTTVGKTARTIIENRNGMVIQKTTGMVNENRNGTLVRKATSLRHRIVYGNDTQCFENLGCFPMDYPWTSILRPLPPPLSPDKIDVRLYCYTREDNVRHTVIVWPEVSLKNFIVKPNRKLVLITHGFLNNGNASWMEELKDYYLKDEDVTVCLVDWGRGSQRLNYLQAASNTRIVGAELATFLKFLQVHRGLKAGNVHLIGHSLGAHISSYVAKAVSGIQRLTALDPAQPAFEGCDKSVCLCKDDANFVEAIHTNAAPFLPYLGFGMMMPCGDVDFYINGGVKQPGCQSASLADVRSLRDLALIPVEMISNVVACSHLRAFEYYKEVLQRNCTIWGRRATIISRSRSLGSPVSLLEPKVVSDVKTCDADSCIPLGLDTPQFQARGVFLASTHTEAPYCYGPEFTSKILSEINSQKKRVDFNLNTARVVNKTTTKRNYNAEEYLG